MSNTLDLLGVRGMSLVPGIDWEALGGVPEEAVFSTGYIYEYLFPAFARYQEVKKDLGWGGPAFFGDTLTEEDLSRAMAVKSQVLSNPLSVEQALHQPVASQVDPIYLKGDDLRYFLSFVAMDAIDVMHMHIAHEGRPAPRMHQLAGAGALSPKDLVLSADAAVRTFNGIHWLWKTGILNSLRRTNAGTGAAVTTGVAAVIALGIVGLVVVVGLLLLAWREQSKIIRLTDKICERALTTKDERLVQACEGMTRINPFAGMFDKVATNAATVTNIVMFGLLAYGGLLMTPYVIRAVREVRKA